MNTTKKAAGKRPAKKTTRVGDVIERTYKGKQLRVKVTKDGFRYGRKTYPSLTAAALEITGAKSISGPYFFNLAMPGTAAKGEKGKSK